MIDSVPVTPKQTAGKAHAAALATFAGVLGAALGFGEMPPGEEVATALGALFASLAAAAATWLTAYYKRNFVKPDKTTLRSPFAATVAALGLALLVTGCGTVFGVAETPAQKTYRGAGIWIYAAIPTEAYLNDPAAQPGAVDVLCRFADTSYRALEAASGAYATGADDFVAKSLAASAALRSFTLESIGSIDLPDSSGAKAQRSIVLATVGLVSLAEMRVFRKEILKPQLDHYEETGTDPSPDELTQMLRLAGERHGRILARCNDLGAIGLTG